MKCRQVLEKMEDFREGMLDSVAENEWRDHLGACKKCRRHLGRLDNMDRRLKQLFSGMTPSPGFPARVVAGLDSCDSGEISGRTYRPAGWILAFPVRAALLVAASLMIAFSFWMALVYRQNAQEERWQAEKVARKEALFYQPDANAPFALGAAFAIGPEGTPVRCAEAGTIRISKVERGVPVLVVEAFPAESAVIRDGIGPSS